MWVLVCVCLCVCTRLAGVGSSAYESLSKRVPGCLLLPPANHMWSAKTLSVSVKETEEWMQRGAHITLL